MLIDTHSHLFMEPLCQDIEGVLKRADDKRVSAIIVPAVDTASWNKVAGLSEYPAIHSALGLHPWCADEELDPDILKKLLLETASVAIGEAGLDFKIENPDRNTQIDVFRVQLDLAAELELPIILHCRGAFEEMLSILSEYAGRITGVVHAFTRGMQLADRFIELGFYLAFGGTLTRPGAKRARNSAAGVPLDKILLETDAPSIGMENVSPDKVEPADVARVCDSLARLRGIAFEKAARATTGNAVNLFGLR